MNKLFFFLLLGSSLFSIFPLFGNTYFPMHDDTQVARVIAMATSLRDGMIPVRWVDILGYGYGYPIFNFYAPFAYYIGGIFMIFGVQALAATKIMFGIGMVTAGISMYLLTKELWGKEGGLLSALLYLYAPYHAVNLYVRGAIGELWAYGFIPLVFFGFYKLFTSIQHGGNLAAENSERKTQQSNLQLKNKLMIWRWIGISAFAYAGLILSHNLTAFIVTPFLLLLVLIFCFSFIRKNRLVGIPYILLAFFLGLIISAFYWIPALFELSYTNVFSILGGKSDPRVHFVCLSQLWASQWGFAGSAPGCLDGMSFMLGKIHVVFVGLTLISIGIFRRKLKEYFPVVSLCIAGLFISLFLMLESSRFIWEMIPAMNYIQFPWRYLSMAVFFSSILGGGMIIFFDKTTKPSQFVKYMLILGIGALVIWHYGKLFQPQYVISHTSKYTDEHSIKWDVSKISDEYLPQDFRRPKSETALPQNILEFTKGSGTIYSQKRTTTHVIASIAVVDDATLRIQKAYFPAWKIRVNDEEKNPTRKDGIYYLDLPVGNYRFEMRFVQTPIEKVANSLSLLGIFAFLAGIIYAYRKIPYDTETS